MGSLLAGLAVAGIVFLTIRQEKIVATVQELKDALAALAAGVDELEAGLKDLKAQVAAGGTASQADLDDLAAKAAEISADIKDTSDQE
jgi:X-X-X-Leu-X-X-Gly heptad repeat protein